MLTSLLHSANATAQEVKAKEGDFDAKEIQRIVLSTLMAHGMRASAACLKHEARLTEQDVEAAKAARLPSDMPLVKNPLRPGQHKTLPAVTDVVNDCAGQRSRLAATAEAVAEQRAQIDALREKVRALRDARGLSVDGQRGELMSADLARMQHSERRLEDLRLRNDSMRRAEAPLREQAVLKQQELRALRELIEKKRRDEVEARRRLAELNGDLLAARSRVPVNASPQRQTSKPKKPVLEITFRSASGRDHEASFDRRPLGFHVGGSEHVHPHVNGVRKGSPAHQRGVEDGWFFHYVNGQHTEHMDFFEVDALLHRIVAELPGKDAVVSSPPSAHRKSLELRPVGVKSKAPPQVVRGGSGARPGQAAAAEPVMAAPRVMAVPVMAAAPPSAPHHTAPEGDKIGWLLQHLMVEHGPVNTAALEIFRQCDVDRDGALRWNEGEIRRFVQLLFEHYNIHLPEWQDRVWYELYRQCDRNQDYALEIDEILEYARHCFELAAHAYGAMPDGHAHGSQPLGHGHRDTEVAGTIQSILASALNPQGGGVLYKVTEDVFQQLDRNQDGRIEWNNGEIKGFVTALFKRYAVEMPQWADQVWYDMFHECQIERRHAITLPESLLFARKCFEAALQALIISH